MTLLMSVCITLIQTNVKCYFLVHKFDEIYKHTNNHVKYPFMSIKSQMIMINKRIQRKLKVKMLHHRVINNALK